MQFTLLSLLVLAVIFVNGWTDAPNSIATVVVTGVLPFRRAAAFAALCELIGVLLMSLLCPTVAETIFSIADFGTDPFIALTALHISLFTILLGSVLAWHWGIPTSESHALIAALTGASAAVHRNFSGISQEAWCRVLFGLFLSTLLGAIGGYLAARIISLRSLSPVGVRRGQILCSGAMAFFHGAQDGQKFLALLLLVNAMVRGQPVQTFQVTPLPAILCACVMSCGVLMGGQRIIHTVSLGMGATNPRRGLAAELAAGLCLLAASVAGLPVSTTHTKISALLGAGTSTRASESSARIIFRILAVWLVTFPCCGFLAWGLTLLMLS